MKKILTSAIRLYQLLLSPYLGGQCRFCPSCSQYAIEAIETKGCIKGIAAALVRLFKCHPFHPGGYDPVRRPINYG